MEVFFKPITVNKLTIPNRFAMAPMTRSRSPDGVPGDNVRDYYQLRAAGEVGLIITEGVEVSHLLPAVIQTFRVLETKLMRGWKQVIDAVHSEGSKIFPQLWHVGAFENLAWLRTQKCLATHLLD